MDRTNPYAPSAETSAYAHKDSARNEEYFRWFVATLVLVTTWAIYRISPIGVFVPGGIGLAVSLRRGGGLRRTSACIALAYVVGIAAIFCADLVTHWYDPLILTVDEVSGHIARGWAVLGVLGAIGGAMLGSRIAQLKSRNDGAEQ